MNNLKLTICLVTYNGEKYLPFCLNSVFKQSFKDWQFLIMDNGSVDNSIFRVRELTEDEPRVIILPKQDENIGFAGGYNALMRKAESEYVLLLNQDVILESDYLEKMVNFMDKKEYIGAGIGKILRLTNGIKTSNIDTVGLGIFPSFRTVDLGSGEEDRGQFNENEEIFGASGCLPMYRKKALDKIGYFDEKFFAYKEDVDLAFRLCYANWKAYRVGSAVAHHERGVGGNEKLNDIGAALSRKDKTQIAKYLSYRNHWYVLIKNIALEDWVRYGIFILWYEFKKFIYILLFEQKTLLALVDIFKNLLVLLKQRRKVKLKSVKEFIK